jgi:hypothetical protein
MPKIMAKEMKTKKAEMMSKDKKKKGKKMKKTYTPDQQKAAKEMGVKLN